MKYALFCLRAYNDIDHIAPVIYKWCESNNFAYVLITDPVESFRNDPRINFVFKEFKNINFYHINQFTDVKYLVWILKILIIINNIFPKIKLNFFINIIGGIVIKKFSIVKLFNILHNKKFPNIILFDHGLSKLKRVIIKKAKEYNIKSISLPHGAMVFKNQLQSTTDMDINNEPPVLDYGDVYDLIFCHDKYHFKYFKEGKISTTKLMILGSARFSNEWTFKLSEILPKFHFPQQKTNSLKVLFFVQKPSGNVFYDEVERTIFFISEFPNLVLVVKPHTRRFKIKKKLIKDNIYYAEYEQSPALIDWADVVLFFGTSVILDAMIKGKLCLYLRYLHANVIVPEIVNACWELECRDDLRSAIWSLLNKKNIYRPSQKDISTCLNIMVRAEKRKNSLDSYIEQIMLMCN